jgi:hypothetical protein
MPPVLRLERRWLLPALAILALGMIAILGTAASREALLRSAGRVLLAQDPLIKADIVVISSDALAAGVLEAAELVKAGYATRVGIFDRPVTRVQRELMRRGLTPVDLKSYSLQLLRELGVTDIVVLPLVTGTVDEGRVLRQWCPANSVRTVLFIGVADHSRRTRRVLNRELRPAGITVRVRYARFSEFDPDSWWRTRNGQRVEIIESEKLLLDVLRHPF